MNKTTEALKLAEEAVNRVIETLEYLKTIGTHPDALAPAIRAQKKALTAIRESLAEPVQEPNMKDAIITGNEVLLNEQAWLLRECRGALDSLIKQRPNMAGLLCGSTTLGNLRAELGAYRPSGVMNGTK